MSFLIAWNLEASMQTLPVGWVWEFSFSVPGTNNSEWINEGNTVFLISTSRCFQSSISYLLLPLLTQRNDNPYSSPALPPGALISSHPTFSGTDFHQLYLFPLPWFPFLLCTHSLVYSPLKQTKRNMQENFRLILFFFFSFLYCRIFGNNHHHLLPSPSICLTSPLSTLSSMAPRNYPHARPSLLPRPMGPYLPC